MKYAVVTGSTKGIGKAIAFKLLQEGYFVFANYAHDEQEAQNFAEEAKQISGDFKVIKQELSSYEAAQTFAEQVKAVTQEIIDCLVLNCGVTDRSSFYEVTQESWERVITTNLSVPFYLVQAFGKQLKDEEGRIIFIGSVCGEYPHATSLSYAVTKAAIHQMAKDLVKVFAERKITVNAIAPGFVDTPWQVGKPDEIRRSIESKTALDRFGRPEEIADLCYSVIQNQFINGAVLDINGGYCYK